jgi:hypothetical protein
VSDETNEPLTTLGTTVQGDGVLSVGDTGSAEEASAPIIGDGVLSLGNQGDTKMAIDLPENVAVQLLTETTGNIQANNRNGRDISTTAMGVLQAAAARNFDELGVTESRATSGIVATPIAGPTTQV